jgi:hypothetical protein
MFHISRIQGRFRFEEHHVGFFIGFRFVFHPFRHDDELPLPHDLLAIPEFHPECAFDDKE